tara:strand:+ start:1827 stop:3074 length:1248 start_codon:yes stop_codon:yes gene_type:complete
MKKILHIINNDKDGIFHFVNKLIKTSLKDHENKILAKYSNSKNIIKLDSGKSLIEFLNQPSHIFSNFYEFYLKLLNKFKRDYFNLKFEPNVLFNFFFNEIDFEKLKEKIHETDILIIYTFKEVLSPKDLKTIYDYFKCKIIFYPLDYELLSGGFHFENNENISQKLKKKNYQLINYKKKYLSDLNIHWIAGNQFIENKIQSSEIYNHKFHKITKIYNTLEKFEFSDEEILKFKIENKLNNYDLIVLFSSLKLSDSRKGISELINCLKYYDNLPNVNYKIALVSLGKEINLKLGTKKIDYFHFNYIKDFRHLNLIFNSCDIFMNLSKYDFGPVLCEIAFQNNLFILSSNVGIAGEIVINNLNGFIYKKKEEISKKFEKTIELAMRKKEPLNNDQTSLMKKIYVLNKSEKFNYIFDE